MADWPRQWFVNAPATSLRARGALANLSLAQLLREQKNLIVSRFVGEVQKADFAPPGTPRSALADHIPVFLDEIAAALARSAGEAPPAAAPTPGEPARQHAGQRWNLGYDVGKLVREYGLLRRCIVQTLQEQNGSLSLGDFETLASYVNKGIAEAVTAYASYRDEQAKEKRAHLEFLGEAGEILSSSLDYRSTLARLAGLLVPRLADWCGIHLEGMPADEMPVMHVDPSKIPVLRELYRRYPLSDPARGYAHVLRTGESVLVSRAEPDLVESHAKDAEQLALIRQIHPHSWIIVPLRVQGQTFGALTLAYSESDAHYTEHDLVVAKDMARRAAVAIDNARLYELSQNERSRVEAATRAKDEFVAMVSHELRTPLNAILGWLHMLRTGTLAEERRAHGLEVIERNARAQSRLVSDLLDISRIITGKIRINPSQMELGNVIEMVREGLSPAADAKRIAIQLDIDRESTLMRGDADRLQQVFWNLLANAVKFTPKNGLIKVRLRRVDSDLEAVIEDNGAGIAPEHMPHLFESFRQAAGGEARTHGGLGIGLSIAKHIVELHGGSIEAHSDGPDKGSRFEVRLPISPLVSTTVGVARLPVTPQSVGAPAASGLQGVRVLVVDDEEDARELLTLLFESAGVQVRAAGSAAEALKALETFTPQVIVSDIGMPVDDGYSLIRSIRTLPSPEKNTIPAIALTAFARAEDRTRALVAGFTHHMAKPVEADALMKLVAELIR